jgi:flagellar secretion chaperone FliS
MQPRVHPAIVGQHYRSLELKSRVESASPHGLVSLLYEELLRSLDLANASLDKGRTALGGSHAARAQSIIIALEGSIDFEKGGDLATTLARVYRACRQELNRAAPTGDLQKLAEVRDAVSDIAYAWQTLAEPKA